MNLLFWGMFGLTVELVFTAIKSVVVEKKLNLMGHTSLWMFPIYAFGLTYGIELLNIIIPCGILRYISYPFIIWAIEILVGYPATKLGIKIWDYSYLPNKMHWRGIISYVYFPLWIGFGILVEAVHHAR